MGEEIGKSSTGWFISDPMVSAGIDWLDDNTSKRASPSMSRALVGMRRGRPSSFPSLWFQGSARGLSWSHSYVVLCHISGI